MTQYDEFYAVLCTGCQNYRIKFGDVFVGEPIERAEACAPYNPAYIFIPLELTNNPAHKLGKRLDRSMLGEYLRGERGVARMFCDNISIKHSNKHEGHQCSERLYLYWETRQEPYFPSMGLLQDSLARNLCHELTVLDDKPIESRVVMRRLFELDDQ